MAQTTDYGHPERVFMLADRMQRTELLKTEITVNKNGTDFPLFSIWIIFGTYGMF